MPRGRKKTHKGGHRHFTNEDDLQVEAEKARKEREWRQMKGIESDEEEPASGVAEGAEGATAAAAAVAKASDEETSSEEEEAEDDKPKGVSHLIEIENPNRIREKTKKVSDLAIGGAAAEPTMSRKEKEEIQKQQAKEHYQKMHLAGKTDEARADLARLALIRKQREDAAKKRDEEKKAQDDAKFAAENRLLEKKQKSGSDAKH